MRRLMACLGFWALTLSALATPTEITVRVLARDAKFIGTGMEGAQIRIEDVETGAVLAQGLTAGGTGDTEWIMREPRQRGKPIAADAAAFNATVDIDEPRLIRVVARGPQNNPASANEIAATQWVVPGRHLTGGDGWVLEMPGLVIELVDAPAHGALADGRARIPVTVKVTMMCGCPLTPGGLWDADEFEIKAVARQNDQDHAVVTLDYAGKASHFSGELELNEAGPYELVVYAFQAANGNTGVVMSMFVVTE